MKLFPDVGADRYLSKGLDIKKELEDFYYKYNDKNQIFWYEADLDARFEAGDQDVVSELYPNVPKNRRTLYSFNRIRRVVNMVSGHQRNNRKSTIVIPVENSDQETADQYTKVISSIHRSDHVLDTISEAFHEALTVGVSFLHLWNDYRNDPINGSLRVDHLSYSSFIIDPYFKKSDLSDCNGIWKRSFITKTQALSLLPDKKKIISEVAESSVENLFTFMPEHDTRDISKLLAYDEYYYLSSRKQILLTDARTKETTEWQGEEDSEQLQNFLRDFPEVTASKISVPTVRLAILLQGVLIFDDINPLGIDSYPFVPVFAYFNPNISSYSLKIQGMVRGLRDAQYLFNRRKNIELDILESQVNSGYIYKEDALVNPGDVFLSGEGKGIAIKSDSNIQDVVKIQPAQIPPSMLQLSDLMAREIMEISGVNEELLGSAQDDKAGVLSMLRQSAGVTTLSGLFDQLDRSQKILGSITLSAIQSNYSAAKIKRIIEEEPTPHFYDKSFAKFDAAIEEGFNTTTQKQLEFAQLVKLKELQIPIPDETIIEAATVQNKTKLLEAINKINQQGQAQMQRQMQTEEQLKTAQAELAKAKVESDLALAKERDSRVYSNIGLMHERELEAEKDKTQSMLNLVKTLQEIDSIDLEQLAKLINLSAVVKGANNSNKTERMGTAIVSGATQRTDAGQQARKPTL